MISLFLAPMKGQLFGFQKELVAGVGGRKNEPNKSPNNGQKHLRLPSGERAYIFHFRDLLDNRFSVPQAQLHHYLILHYQDSFAALSIDGRGQWATLIEPAFLPLPPCFSQRSRAMIPSTLQNGQDVILMPDMDTLFTLIASEENREAAIPSTSLIDESPELL